MNERDTRVVENMARTGMEFETLYHLFQKFPREEVEKAYRRIQLEIHARNAQTALKTNCS